MEEPAWIPLLPEICAPAPPPILPPSLTVAEEEEEKEAAVLSSASDARFSCEPPPMSEKLEKEGDDGPVNPRGREDEEGEEENITLLVVLLLLPPRLGRPRGADMDPAPLLFVAEAVGDGDGWDAAKPMIDSGEEEKEEEEEEEEDAANAEDAAEVVEAGDIPSPLPPFPGLEGTRPSAETVVISASSLASMVFLTCTGMFAHAAGTRHFGCSTLAPMAASSCASRNVSARISRALGTWRGSAVIMPFTSVQISQRIAPIKAAKREALVSEPPRPNRHVAPAGVEAMKPWQMTTS